MAFWRVHVLGDTRHDACVPLWWVGPLVASCVCLRARVCVCDGMVAGSATLVGMCVRCALGLRKSEASWLRHARVVQCASWARIAGAVSSTVTSRMLCCTAVLRLRTGVVACALLHRASLWLLCDFSALRGIAFAVECSCLCVSLCCVLYTRALPPRCSGRLLRVCCRRRRRRQSLAVRATHQCETCRVIVHVAVAV